LLAALKQHFGFEDFRPGQQAIVEDVLAGRDVLAVMPTGGGKSLCFQLPALMQAGVMIVVSPLIALMQDQVRLLAANGVAATFLNSSLSGQEVRQRMDGLLRGKHPLLYLAPERLLMADFLHGFLPQLQQAQGICAFTVDEAHCVSEWGHDFRPEYRQMSALRGTFPSTPVLAFTATATPRVRDDICQQLGLLDPARHLASFDRPNLLYRVAAKSPKTYLAVLAQASKGGCGVVYCLSRKRVDELAAKLQGDGIRALPYHAGLTGEQRAANQDAFIRDDAQVMVATVAFGMGISKPDVRWVVHYDLPKSLEGYYQEAGRAGRDGASAECTLYFGAGDIQTANFLIAQKTDPETGEALLDEQAQARKQLRQVLDYAESTLCRRSVQLAYFGEAYSGPCQACDNCLEPKATIDRSRDAQMLLSTIARLAQLGQRYGAGHVLDVLTGQTTEKIQRSNHQQLSTFGIGSATPLPSWRDLLRQLKHQGLVEEHGEPYPVLVLNAASRMVLKGERQVLVTAPPEQETKLNRRSVKAARQKQPVAVGDEALFQALRALRKQLADAQNLPPYIVFGDATLLAMAADKPQDLDAFAQIPGVGAAKLARYGADFVQCIRQQSIGKLH
jgi:ATP-dependent DNA helicase RecQ